ncbi:unnamed protein product [Lactuca virosa]|uniref:SAM domain-containing protein n=1 Tax=Lactuca virosa TaxID=75947 RepID=A0AAU9MVS0_9ASTR|nr:unnamed protein product [Lactuca virosa]
MMSPPLFPLRHQAPPLIYRLQPPSSNPRLLQEGHWHRLVILLLCRGVNAGISCVLRRLRGKEDVQSSMAAGFGSGVMFSLVSGMGGPNQASNAIASGVFFALVQGGVFKVREKISKPNPEDLLYNETRGMLTSLGLGHYEKNFKRGLLTDSTLPLLTDSALQDARIPPGPRLLILDHIEREEVKKKSAFPHKW